MKLHSLSVRSYHFFYFYRPFSSLPLSTKYTYRYIYKLSTVLGLQASYHQYHKWSIGRCSSLMIKLIKLYTFTIRSKDVETKERQSETVLLSFTFVFLLFQRQMSVLLLLHLSLHFDILLLHCNISSSPSISLKETPFSSSSATWWLWTVHCHASSPNRINSRIVLLSVSLSSRQRHEPTDRLQTSNK